MLLHWKKNPWRSAVLMVAGVFFLLTLLLVLNRYYSFYTTTDHGIFNQVFWNNLHGNWFQSSLSSALSASVVQDDQVPEVFYHRLGQHFTPALLLWLPLYALWPSGATLAVLQVTLMAIAGLVLYALARQHLPPPPAAMITFSFYGANAILGPTLGNFFDFCQIPLLVFSLLLAMEKRWWWGFWPLAMLILLVREDAGVVLFGVGAYLIVSRRYPRVGLAVCTLSFGYMLMLTNVIMPWFSQDISRRFMIENFGQYADGDQATTLEILWGIVSNPLRLLGALFTPFSRKLSYLLGQWLPLALVPAVAPHAWTIAGFPLLQIFLQQEKGPMESPLSINLRYAISLIPGLFYGTILWWANHSERFRLSFRRFWIGCIALSLVFTFTANPHRAWYFLLPDSINPWVYRPLVRQWDHAQQVRSLLAQIPDDATVSASRYLVPHLSNRRGILRFPLLQLRDDTRQVVDLEYVIVDLWQWEQYQVAFKNDRRDLQESVVLIEELLGDRHYGVLGFQDGVILLQRGVTSQPEAIAAWSAYQQAIDPILQKPL